MATYEFANSFQNILSCLKGPCDVFIGMTEAQVTPLEVDGHLENPELNQLLSILHEQLRIVSQQISVIVDRALREVDEENGSEPGHSSPNFQALNNLLQSFAHFLTQTKEVLMHTACLEYFDRGQGGGTTYGMTVVGASKEDIALRVGVETIHESLSSADRRNGKAVGH
ncbi:MAG: hypothetical protein WCA27_03635 [Candidatus Sulfotelmatobacter sp.]